MYHDNNKDLARQRNEREVAKLLPFLNISVQSRVLDVACGIGRWADAITEEIDEYCGVDFSEELVTIAKKRIQRKQISFVQGKANEVESVLHENGKGKYNTVLLIGILMYLNDGDVEMALEQVERCLEEKSVVCIREPIGITERLTLKDFFSTELQDNYNAIYRTRDQLAAIFDKTLLNKDFHIKSEGVMFEEASLNNRTETTQYYFILER